MEKESILKGIFKYSISTWVNFVFGFLYVIISTRLLSPSVYGQISFFMSITGVLMYVMLMGMDGAYIRYYNEPPAKNTKPQLLYKNLLITTFFFIAVAFVAIFIYGKDLSIFFFQICSKVLVGYVFLYTFCQSVLRYLNISYRMSFQTKKYNIQNILINNLFRLLIIIAAIFTDRFEFIIAVLTIGLFSVCLVYFYIQHKEYTPISKNGDYEFNLNLKGYKPYFRFALFSAPTYIVFYLNGYFNQQIIMMSLGASAVGIFSSTHMFSQILAAMQGGFSTFWSAYVYKNYKNDKNKIVEIHDYVLIFAIIAVSILILSRDAIFLFIGKNFHESKSFFSLILMMPVLNLLSETTSKGISIANKNEYALFAFIICLITNIALCLLLIPQMGLIGAAWSNAISSIILYVINTIYGQRYYRTIRNIKKSCCGTIMIIALLAVPSFTTKMLYIVTFYTIININIFLVYHKEIRNIYGKISQVVINKKNRETI